MAAVWPCETRGVWSKQNGWCIYSLPWHVLSASVNLDQILSPLNGDCPYTSFGPYSIHLQKLFLYLSSLNFCQRQHATFWFPVPYYTWLSLSACFFKRDVLKGNIVFAPVMRRYCEFHGVRTLQNMVAKTWCYPRLDIHFLLLKVLKNIIFSLHRMMESFKICVNK